jgi:hypothetical protein
MHEVIANRPDGTTLYTYLNHTGTLSAYEPKEPIVGDYTITDHCRYIEPMPDPQWAAWEAKDIAERLHDIATWDYVETIITSTAAAAADEIERLTTARPAKVSPTTPDALLRLALAIERLAGAIERHR